VVVVCEKCETRFQLGDSRVPAGGTRVRCSRCEHEFFVASPKSGEADVIGEVMAEVTDAGGTPATEAGERSTGDFEEDWQFNDDSHPHIQMEAEPEPSDFGEFDSSGMDLSGEDPLSEEAPPSGEASRSGDDPLSEFATDVADSIGEPEPEVLFAEKPSIDPVESIRDRDAGLDFSSPDDLGSPEEWDFVGTAEVEPPLEFIPEDDAPEAFARSVDESVSALPSPAVVESPTAEESDRALLAARFAGVASIAGWVVVALAFSVGISSLFTGPGEGGAVSAGPAEITVSDLPITASEVEGRLVENALVGTLLVVSGKLENRGSYAVTPGRAVSVQLVSAGGVPIAGATAPVGRAVAETRLREWDPDRLRLDLERSAAEMAQRPFRPGAPIRFDAVFETIPESAAGWVLEAATSPSHPDPGSSPLSTTPLAWE
jgi:predicted Zn finger-like uncharacterized protein